MEVRKIIHVLMGKANPNTMNGVNKVVHNLASTQLLQGYDVEVWGITKTPDNIPHQHSYPLRLFKASRNRFTIAKEMLEALNAVESGTIMHLHSVFIPELYVLSTHLRRHDIKWVLTPHGGYAPDALKRNALAKFIYNHFFESRLVEGASALHAIGRHGEADQFDDATSKKVGLVPNGYDIGERSKTDWSHEGPLRLCYCGRLDRIHKGLDLLLTGVGMVLDSGVRVHLDLIGDGPDRQILQGMARKLGIFEIVTFHGVKTGTEKDDIILQQDCFVHTSRWDVVPTAVLEAAAMGLPLMVSIPTNMAEYTLAADAGYVVDVLSPKCIKDAILTVARDKRTHQLRAKGIAARRMIRESFSWDFVCRAIANHVYAKI